MKFSLVLLPLIMCISLGFFVFMTIRATLPRYRIDALVLLCWKYLLLSNVFLLTLVLYTLL